MTLETVANLVFHNGTQRGVGTGGGGVWCNYFVPSITTDFGFNKAGLCCCWEAAQEAASCLFKFSIWGLQAHNDGLCVQRVLTGKSNSAEDLLAH